MGLKALRTCVPLERKNESLQNKQETPPQKKGKKLDITEDVLRRRLQALGVSIRPSLRFPLSPHLHRRRRHLDRRVVVDVHMPLLLVRDGTSRACAGADQGPHSCDGVVHISDPLLAFFLLPSFLFFILILPPPNFHLFL